MITVGAGSDLASYVGKTLGVSDWVTLDLQALRDFGRLTGDQHWVHTDPDRAAREMPGGEVIAHGFLLLSLITNLSHQIYTVSNAKRWINYGIDRLRFTAPVTPRDRVRLEITLANLEPLRPDATRLTLNCRLDVEGHDRPALVAHWIVIAYE
ncbi:MaoC family dehydratase [Bradyrhizobium sp. USDA 4469]